MLKADDTLPKVTQILSDDPVDVVENNGYVHAAPQQYTYYRTEIIAISGPYLFGTIWSIFRIGRRFKRQTRDEPKKEDDIRAPRKFCDGGGVFCALYRAFQGDTNPTHQVAERREELGTSLPR